MNSKTYKCKCGKEFTYSQAYNGHLANCKVYLKMRGKEKEYLQTRIKIKEALIHKAQEKHKIMLDQWISEQHRCEKCDKIMSEKYGSGRFCSRSCANSKKHSEETKKKISASVRKVAKEIETTKHPIFRKGYYKDYYCASSYELAFLACMLYDNVSIERAKDSFLYINPKDGNTHKYYPDFYMPETDTYVELKGKSLYYEKEIVQAKSDSIISSSHNFLYIDDTLIDPYIKKVKSVFNVTDISCLYDHKKIVQSKKHVPRTKGRIWVYNNILQKQTLIEKENLKEYENNGWTKGRPSKSSFKNI